MEVLKFLAEFLRVFNDLNERIVAQDQQIKTLQEQIMPIKDQVQQLGSRLDVIEQTLTDESTELRAIVKALEDRVADVENLDISPELNRLSNMAIKISGLSEAVVAPPPDAEIPSTPGTPTADSVGATSVSLSWSASTDNVSVAGYEVFQNGEKIGDASSTSFSAGGLTPETNYVFAVRAKDAAGNFSALSDGVSVTTLA